MKLKKVRGYIFSRSFMGERVPQHIQNIIISDFCKKNDLYLLLSATEYCMDKSISIFKSILEELSKVSGIVLYSIFVILLSSIFFLYFFLIMRIISYIFL